MTTLPSNTAIGPDTPITARMSAGEWGKVIGLMATAVVAGSFYVSSWNASVEKATSKAEQANRLAEQAFKHAEDALSQSTAVKADLQNALVALSAKLGRIEGLLERLTQETHK